MGATPAPAFTALACARMRPISSAFCSPVEHCPAGIALRAVDHVEIAPVRTPERAARRPVETARIA